MQFHRLFEYPQMIPFSLYFCSKRCRVTRVSFLLLPSQFILEDWHIKQPGGRCIGSWASAIEFKKTHRHGKTLSIVPKIYGLVYLHGSELAVDFFFRLFVTRLKRTRRALGPMSALFIMFLVRDFFKLMMTLFILHYLPLLTHIYSEF
jgi:hypothetical protein